MKMHSYETIDEYITNFPEDIQKKLQTLRQTIKQTAPEAVEKIGYGIPTFTFHGNLVHFAAYENHIGFYPGASPIEVFAKELKAYKTTKGTIQFPLDKPLPLDLVRTIVAYRIEENVNRKKKPTASL